MLMKKSCRLIVLVLLHIDRKYRCNLLIFLIVNDCDLPALYRLEKRNLRNQEPEASVASRVFFIAKIFLLSL